MTVGGLDAMVSGRWVSPINAVSSSRTILTTCCPGVKLRITSCPRDCSRTRCTKSLTTWKLTSASRRARRISRIASWMFTSVSLPRPRKREKIPSSFAVSDSNTRYPYLVLDAHAVHQKLPLQYQDIMGVFLAVCQARVLPLDAGVHSCTIPVKQVCERL